MEVLQIIISIKDLDQKYPYSAINDLIESFALKSATIVLKFISVSKCNWNRTYNFSTCREPWLKILIGAIRAIHTDVLQMVSSKILISMASIFSLGSSCFFLPKLFFLTSHWNLPLLKTGVRANPNDLLCNQFSVSPLTFTYTYFLYVCLYSCRLTGTEVYLHADLTGPKNYRDHFFSNYI